MGLLSNGGTSPNMLVARRDDPVARGRLSSPASTPVRTTEVLTSRREQTSCRWFCLRACLQLANGGRARVAQQQHHQQQQEQQQQQQQQRQQWWRFNIAADNPPALVCRNHASFLPSAVGYASVDTNTKNVFHIKPVPKSEVFLTTKYQVWWLHLPPVYTVDTAGTRHFNRLRTT